MMYEISETMLALGGSPAISIVAKATLVVALALAGSWMARRNRAAVRHTLLASAFGVLLMLPIASVLAPPLRIALPLVTPEQSVSSRVAEVINADAISPSAPLNFAVAPASPRAARFSLSDLLLIGWAVGVALLLLPVIRGLRQVRLLRSAGLPWRSGQLAVDTLALDAGLNRHVEVLLHKSLPGPMTCGIVRPAIMLPPDAPMWDAGDLNRAIVHELEHVRRGDWATYGLSQIVCAAYWFHPLVWIASRELALEAERSCDDAVLGRSEATAYADQLVGLAQKLSRSPALAMASRSDLSARVGGVLDARQPRGRAGKLLVAIACTAATALVLTMSPLRIVLAQTTERQPAFEVASVKPSDPQHGRMGIGLSTYPGGRIIASNSTLHLLIMYAFDTELFQFPGAPGWVDDDRFRFDIEARPPASSASSRANPPYPKAPPTDEQRQMLRTLLVERFGLKYHRETKEAPVYLLVRSGGKLALQEPKDKEVFPWAGTATGGPVFSNGMAGINVSMAQLAKRLTPPMGHPVLDKTGLDGSFDFKVAGIEGEPNSDVVSEILSSLQALGLKLESAKGQVETVVIDHAEKPSLN